MTPNYHQSFNIHLIPLSPIHIGNGEELTSTGEFLTTSEYIYFLDHDKLMDQLKQMDLFEEYVEKILEAEKGFDFYDVLNNWNIDIQSLTKRSVKLHQQGLNPANNNVLHLHIKTNNQPYIPGSSIKGLLRMAILFKYLQDHPETLSDIEGNIEDKLNYKSPLWALKQYWSDKERKLLPEKVFQAIRPYDSELVPDKELLIVQTYRRNLYSDDSDGLDWLTECIFSTNPIPFEFTLYADFENFDYFNFLKKLDLNSLFKIINLHSLRLINQELELLQRASMTFEVRKMVSDQLEELKKQIEISDNEYAITRLGKGKTIFFQTILPLLNQELRNQILNLFKKEDDTGEIPRTRVLSVKDKLLFGWMKLTGKENNDPSYKAILEEQIQEEVTEGQDSVESRKKEPEKEFTGEKRIHDNKIKGAIEKGMVLEAYYYQKKEIDLSINGKVIKGIQLNKPKFPKNVKPDQLVKIEVKQVTKSGKIHQVALK